MKFSANWLRDFVDTGTDVAELARRLTLGGLEVAGVQTLGAGLDGVIVARIVACAAHPNADRLHVCRVDTGKGELQIVCGAPNARVGLVAPLAMLGAKLPGGVAIKAAKLRGMESSGMLCSARELGIDADASGLMELPADAPIGALLTAYLGLPDSVIDVDLTPNRGDCLGMLGLADEVAAECGTRAKPFVVAPVEPAIAAPRAIELAAGAACPRYLGRAVHGVDGLAQTPIWMAQRLRAADVHAISVVVDITNYVMLETGQPMHAFDEALLAGGIVVRHARQDETLKLLDGSVAKLEPGFLVIADQDKPLAVAGVMGGFDCRVTAATHDVFLEAAHFAPAAIMGRARKLGLATDAAFRFERGVDPELPRAAMERATALLLEIAGGQAGQIIESSAPGDLPAPRRVGLRRARITRVLGTTIADAEVERILGGLGMRVEAAPEGWFATPPSRRFDIEREEDLIEEVARIHGYDALPMRLPAGAPPAPHADALRVSTSALSAALVARDYHEAICYAFVDPQLLEKWQLDAHAVPLANPLSTDLAVMRTSLLPGLVEALKHNRNHQQERVRLFETGVVFAAAAARGAGHGTPGLRADDCGPAPLETTLLAAVACGPVAAEQWAMPARALDFFDLKGDLQALLAQANSPGAWTFDAGDLPPWIHPGRGARVSRDGVAVGAVGALHPALQRSLGIPDTYVFEIALSALRMSAVPVAKALPRFPSLRRDIAIEVKEDVGWAELAAAIRGHASTIVNKPLLFDCFRGPGVDVGHKSLAIGLILQDESRTLTDHDADAYVAGVVALLAHEFGARLRG